jgi:hypothetical protein
MMTPPGVRRELIALAGLAVLVLVTAVSAELLLRAGTDLRLFSAPFFGQWRPRISARVLAPLAIGAAVVLLGPRVTRALRWSALLAVAWLTTIVWSVALSGATGWNGLTRTLRSRYDYAAALPEARRLGLGPFVRTYVDRLADYPTHVKSHPPGVVVFLRVLELVGLRGNGWAAAAMIAFAATVPCAIAVIVGGLAGRSVARPLLPFLVCGPWTLMVVTVADGAFAAVAAWSAALLVVAVRSRSRRLGPALAFASGVVMGLGLYASYGLVPILAVVGLAIVVAAGALRLVVPVTAGVATVGLAWTTAGFDWIEGLQGARAAYHAGVASQRPYLYFVVANLVVFSVMLGPAVVAALCRRLDPAVIPVVAASLAAVAIADLSGLSKGEVERIWLPFVPFVTVAATRLARRPLAARWLAAQAGTAIVLQFLIDWPW